VWNTSWGVSTRLVGALIMTHSDDLGLVCPPRLAQYQVVIVPIYKTDAERATVLETSQQVRKRLAAAGIRVHVDAREGIKPGAKYYEWEGRGVPLRLEIGPRDVASNSVMLARRTGGKKEPLPMDGLPARLTAVIDQFQADLLAAALARREAASLRGATKEQFIARMENEGGLVYGGFCGRGVCESEIKEQTKATIRVLPDPEFRSPVAPTQCMWCGRPSVVEAVWAKAY
jgi:prolyl-tRNA synthetase